MLYLLALFLVALGIVIGGKAPGRVAKAVGWVCYTLAALVLVLAIFG